MTSVSEEGTSSSPSGPVTAELRSFLRRYHELSAADQLNAYAAISEHLGEAAPVPGDRQADERLEALRMLQLAVEQTGASIVTIAVFDATMKLLGTGWNASRVARAWGRWRFAQDALAGGRARPTAKQRALTRARVGHARTHEDYLWSIRLWLDTAPLMHRRQDYDAWRDEFNSTRRDDQLPAPLAGTICLQLGLHWAACITVARGEVDLESARAEKRGKRTVSEDTLHDLISTQTIALMLGIAPQQTRNRTHRPGFPRPVGTFDPTTAWLREDVEAHLRGEPVPRRDMRAIRAQYLSPREVAAMIGLSVESLHNPKCRVPPAAGYLGRKRIWRRDVVEAWLLNEVHARKRARRRR